jgi:pimeloyl-ACP methyl ester carboxylesterase
MRTQAHRFGVFAPLGVAVVLGLTTLSSASAQDRVPRLDPAECPIQQGDWSRDAKLECKWLIVPETRGNPNTRLVNLAVVILRAREPNGSPPLVMLHGGPGGSGIQTYTRGVQADKLDQFRDVVIYDQRASGFSEPKLCPGNGDVEAQTQKLKTRQEREKLWQIADRKCIASLDAQKIERTSYSTATSTQDLIDLRQTLGYSTWDIYGGSYGARLAQDAMRRDGKAIRSVLLDSPTMIGPATQSEGPLSAQRALERVFADCADQPDCRTAFPTLQEDFYWVYDDLAKSPLAYQPEGKSAAEVVWLDGVRLIGRIRNVVLRRPGRLARLPLIINEFRRGDKTKAARLLLGGGNPEGGGSGDQVLVHLIHCYDIYGKQFLAEKKLVDAQVRAPFRREDRLEDCRLWQKRSADPGEYAPVRSDIPTLILTGRYDDRTTTEHAERIATTLSKAHVYEFPNEGHGARPVGCHLSIMNQFWENPLAPLDVTCISKIPLIRFITSWNAISGGQRTARNNR